MLGAGGGLEQGQQFSDGLASEISARNLKLAITSGWAGHLVWEKDFLCGRR